MKNEATLGRPPLPDHKKRNNRRVALFTDPEIEEIDAYLSANDEGVNDLMRRVVLAEVRRWRRDGYTGLEGS